MCRTLGISLISRLIEDMPNRCVAVNCSQESGPHGINLYRFPPDPLRAEWVKFVRAKRALWKPGMNSYLCADHFTENCFDRSYELKQQFGIKSDYRRLQEWAVPTIQKKLKPRSGAVPEFQMDNASTTKRKRSAFEKRERKRTVKDLLDQVKESLPHADTDSSNPTAILCEEINSQISSPCHHTYQTSQSPLQDVTDALLALSQGDISIQRTDTFEMISDRHLQDVTDALLSLSRVGTIAPLQEDIPSTNTKRKDTTEMISDTHLQDVTDALLSLSRVGTTAPLQEDISSTNTQTKDTTEMEPVIPKISSKACQTPKRDGFHKRSVRLQARPHVKTKATSTESVAMVSVGVQCSLLQPQTVPIEDDDINEVDPSTDHHVDCEKRDPTWLPQDREEDSEYFEEFKEFTRESPSPMDDRKYIVFESQLLELFLTCPVCCSKTVARRRCRGTLLVIVQTCDSCSFHRDWTSQPFLGNFPAGNILLSASILFSGSLPFRVFSMLDHLGLVSMSMQSFFNHQRSILHPVIESVWKKERCSLMTGLKEEGSPLVLGGDGRADTPGHNAKFGSYSMMDLKTKKVIHVELVQSNEVKNSNAMEKEGFQRGVQLLQTEGLTLGTLITDRHPQIQKLVRESMPEVSHLYDVWHVAKGLRKKLESLAKETNCQSLSPWIRSIINHLYWCAASTPPGDPELVLEKWRSVINHVQNIHVGHGARFKECQHPLEGIEAPKRKWLKSGTKVAEKLGLLLEKPRLLRDIRKISPLYQTSAVESFHRTIIAFAPKMIGFSYMGMLSRLYLSAMHFNENGARPQARDDSGELRFRITYKKYRKGQHVLTKATSDMTYEYVGRLLTEVCHQARQSQDHRTTTSHIVVPASLTSQFPRVSMDQAIQSHLSRFNNQASQLVQSLL